MQPPPQMSAQKSILATTSSDMSMDGLTSVREEGGCSPIRRCSPASAHGRHRSVSGVGFLCAGVRGRVWDKGLTRSWQSLTTSPPEAYSPASLQDDKIDILVLEYRTLQIEHGPHLAIAIEGH